MHLTKPQKLIYDMEKFAGGAIAVIGGSMLINGKKDLSEIKRAVNEIYRLNDALRIRISESDGEISQSVTEYIERNIEVLYFDNKAELDRYAENYAKTPINFYGNLCEINIVILPEQYGLLVKLHHIISDAWTLSLIGNQFNALLNGDIPEAYSYTNYIESENTYLNSKRYAKDRAYFLEQFKKCDEVTYINEKSTDSLSACRKTFVIDLEKAKQITDYAQQSGTSAFMLFTAALSTYINRTKMNAEKFYIGTAVLNRNGIKENNTAGMFVNTVPMLIELDNTKSFSDNLSAIESTAFSIFRHQKYNYGDVLSAIRKEYSFTEKLYDVMISYQNATIVGTDIETTWYHSGMQNESLQIHIDDRDNEGIFRIHYDYQTEKFTEYDIDMLHQHICNLIFDAVKNDTKKLYELELLTADEKQKLLYEFNDTAVDYQKDKCVHHLFEEQVEKTPNKIAVIACDRTLTYAELNEQANRIAHSLIEKGVKQGDIVAFMLPRKSYLIAAMFGILKSGAAYLPIDPDYPQDRIEYMLSDSKAKFCVTEENINDLISNSCADNLTIAISSENLCYCIYTSGSTGKPKGTVLTHRNVCNYCDNNNNNNVVHRIIKDSYKNIVSVTTVGFDIFVTESLLPLTNGMEVLLANEEQAKLQSEFNDLIKSNSADVMQTTPTKMKSLIADKTQLDYLKTVKVIILGGEALDSSLVEELKKLTDAEIFNIYGPTETTVWVANAEIKKSKCLFELFEGQVGKTPDKTAIIACDRTLTYSELNEEANKIAHSLIDQGVKVGDIVAFMLPRKSHLIATLLGILKAGAAYLPIDPDYPQDRIEYMLEDSKAKLCIDENNVKSLLDNNKTENPYVKVSSESLFCCIYTSGSTGQPKGVILNHRNFCNYFSKHIYIDSIRKCTSVFCISNVIFDMFINEVFSALLFGLTLILASESDIHSPQYLSDLIIKYQIESMICTPTKFSIYLNDKNFQSALSNVKLLTFGGEILTEELCNNIATYSNAMVINGYGPTGTTIVSSYGETIKNDITIGKPIANTQIYIVDKYMCPTPIGVTGELCIAGDGVGAGYLNRPELTAEKFIDNPFGKGKLYKTGDLAYWRKDGNIVYVGRNDFQVKIRGLRIELGEIENAICSMDGISHAVVVVRKNTEGRQLICAFYSGTEIDAKNIRSHIGKKLPKYMLPHIFTHLDEMPLTSSGKINRKALPEVDLYAFDTTVEYIAPQTEREKILVSAVEATLSIDKVGIMDNFFDIGGDSLKAIELISKLEKQGYHTDTKTIFDCDTVKELAQRLTVAETAEEIFNFFGDIPATDAQMRVYTAQNMYKDSTIYNVPYVFKADKVDIDRLQAAVNKLIDRHEILRTHFENKDGNIIQVVNSNAVSEVEILKSDDITSFIRPFDLTKSPLLRVGIYENTVMIDMHHIITDGGSMPVFFKELNELYMGRELNNAPVQYKQFSVRRQDHTESEQYWLSVFNDEIPILEINTDFKRGQKQTFNGSAIYDSIDIELHNKILAFCKEQNITPFIFYMGAFNILLSKFSGNEDIVVGMPISGRDAKYLGTIGMFVNTVALRNKPVGTKTITEFLQEVKENSVNAINHQDYPYGELVKKLNINTANRNPLFDVMFAYQSEQMTDVVFGDKKAELLPVPITTSKYDFTFNIMPRANDVVIMAEYCTDLYKENTMQRFVDGYKQILNRLLNGKAELKDISAISKQEQQKILYVFNDTAVDYPKDKCIHRLFEEQAAKTPDRLALKFGKRTFTFSELNNLANGLAVDLQNHGVGHGDVVAIISKRSYHIVVAMLAIFKCGAAYLPIDYNYPKDRIDTIANDADCKAILTYHVDYASEKTINIPEEIIPVSKNLDCAVYPKDICGIIYTSGSTGTPKGTLLHHQGLVNYTYANNALYEGGSCNIGFAIYTFDAFFLDLIPPMLRGNIAVMATEEEQFNQIAFENLIKNNPECNLFITPAKLKQFIDNRRDMNFYKKIHNICIGGEVFPQEFIDMFSQSTNVFNVYGPTECSMWMLECPVTSEDVTLGKPMGNVQVYILDKNGLITPIGVTGELCIAGDGVGAGYLNRPELTAKKFIDNPFGKGKLYKTGDLAYWREDGNIVYVGRNDFQVKIRGLRIELGEIENAICGINSISQSVVVVRKNTEGRQLICAFYTGTETDAKDIRSHIGKKLPKYMLPHIFTHLDEMPLTSSGKINRKALLEIDLANIANDTEYVAAETQVQKELCKLIELVLGTTPVGITDDFFDLGGDSLKAIEFVSKAHNEGIYFNLQNVFDYSTVKTLCECIENGDKQVFSFADVDFTEVDRVLEKNKVEYITAPEKTEMGNILLAGATGFLGIHILADYLDNDKGMAYCLVRGKDKTDCTNRLKELLHFYFGDKYTAMHRIEVFCADLQKDKFGLTESEYKELLGKIDTVINCAASVKHYGSYKYFYEANVETTKRLIEFCKAANAKLIHTSTLSVSGNSFGDAFDGYISETEKHFYESSLYIDQPLDNVYGRSKFEAEKAVLDAMVDGLQANIMRMGNLTNRLDGVFQKNYESNAFLQRLKGILELGLFPDYLIKDTNYAEFTPIDEAAHAVMTITRNFSTEQTVFHINSIKVVYFDKLLKIFNEIGFDIRTVSGAEFTEALRQTAKQASMEHIFETFINDMDENDQLNYDSNIRIENDFTVQYLKLLGFEWSDIGIDYLRKYVEYFRKIGYLKKRES